MLFDASPNACHFQVLDHLYQILSKNWTGSHKGISKLTVTIYQGT